MTAKFSLEQKFDVTFTARLAQREKQIQQNYRPIIGVHKWFARRPGTVFRNLLLAEFNGHEQLATGYWRAHTMRGVIADPFMGGGTPVFEANRLGFSVVATDINPMSFWIVRQSLAQLDLAAFTKVARQVTVDVEKDIGSLYTTTCATCGDAASVKYFIWVKTQECPACGTANDLFPGYLLAEAERHPRHVVTCAKCGHLNEYDHQPTDDNPERCDNCDAEVSVQGPARRNKIHCRSCQTSFCYPPKEPSSPPAHRMWAIEYHCECCKSRHAGRFFKQPDAEDLKRYERARRKLAAHRGRLPIPEDDIPMGDETRRLHRWGYTRFQEMFNGRQLLGLGLLLRRIRTVKETEIRHALLTVFSDFLRYQNMLCRYDTYALKCQDIFSVHGFPVGLVQCENNLLGIPKIGSGAFRHFVEKYLRAKQYCVQPFETAIVGHKKQIVPIVGERIEAKFVSSFPEASAQREACIQAAPATRMPLPPKSLDGVFTDPPYFDNVQYAELMDFCYAWLRLGLAEEFDVFEPTTTRAHAELTGNESMGRGLTHFTNGLSAVFRHYAAALKDGAPFVFTFHHNDPMAYVPLVVAILDAGLYCTATIPAPAEMGASLHIAGSKSSVLDSIFVCRSVAMATTTSIKTQLYKDIEDLSAAGLKLTEGDILCLLAGHIARIAVNKLRHHWDADYPLDQRISVAKKLVIQTRDECVSAELIPLLLDYAKKASTQAEAHATTL